jgi:hypothetical protein
MAYVATSLCLTISMHWFVQGDQWDQISAETSETEGPECERERVYWILKLHEPVRWTYNSLWKKIILFFSTVWVVVAQVLVWKIRHRMKDEHSAHFCMLQYKNWRESGSSEMMWHFEYFKAKFTFLGKELLQINTLAVKQVLSRLVTLNIAKEAKVRPGYKDLCL